MSPEGRTEAPEVLLRKARNRQQEPAVLLEIGLRLLTERHAEHAEEVFRLGCAVAPERPEFDLGVGACLLQQESYEQAARHLAQHLQRFPDSAVGYFHLATSQYQLGQRDRMMENLFKSITLAPSNQQALAFFFNVLTERGDTQVARAALERIAQDMLAAGPWLFLARRAWDAGQAQEAAGLLDRGLVELQPEDPEALGEAAALLVEMKRADECVELLEERAEVLSFEPLIALAEAYLQVGEEERVAGLLARLRELVATQSQEQRLADLKAALA